ncbi:MAG: S8 family serine peptidase, partial [Halobacteriales archaeon]|nr:S8 family serine peptidase [Halobacteriales archaeon]
MIIARSAERVDERMPQAPSPWTALQTAGVLSVVLGLTVVGVLGGTAVGLATANSSPDAHGAESLASTVDHSALSTNSRHTGYEIEPTVRRGVNESLDPMNDGNRSTHDDPVTTAGVFPFEPAQVDRDQPDDRTPYGIETMYGSPNVVATAGGRGVDVAVLDSGVDRDHPDIVDRIEVCRDYSGPGVRRDSCTDRDGHGTHIAGTIAATGGENGTGIFGVAPEADLWIFKVCARDGNCNSADVAQAIEDAGREGADVIVLSIGGERTPAVQRALSGAEQRGALLVGAAGNSGPDLDTVEHPASDPAVVAVGAVERTNGVDVRASSYRVPEYSSRGVNDSGLKRQEGYLEVTAPGTDVLSTWVGGGYHVLSGTSVAVPHVAGLAARLWSSTEDRDGDGRRNDDVRRALGNRAATFDVTRGVHARRGYDPAAGVGVPRIVTPQVSIGLEPLIPTVGEPVSLTADRVGSGPTTIASYRWDLESDGLVDIIGADVETTFQSPGARPVTLRTVDTAGVVSETTVEVRVNAPPIADYVYAPEVPLAGEEIRFTAIGSGDPDGRVQSFSWDVDEDGG